MEGLPEERRTVIRLQGGLEHELVDTWPSRNKRQVPGPDDGGPWRGFTEAKLKTQELRSSSSSGHERLGVPDETPFQAEPLAEASPGELQSLFEKREFQGQGKDKERQSCRFSPGNESQNWLGELQGLGIITQREEDVWDCDQNMRVRHHFEERTSLHIPYRSAGGGPRPE